MLQPSSSIVTYYHISSHGIFHHRLSSYSTYINTSHHHHLVAAYYLWSTAVIIVKAHFNCLSKVSLHHSSLTLRQAVSRRGVLAEILASLPSQDKNKKLFHRHCLSDKEGKKSQNSCKLTRPKLWPIAPRVPDINILPNSKTSRFVPINCSAPNPSKLKLLSRMMKTCWVPPNHVSV